MTEVRRTSKSGDGGESTSVGEGQGGSPLTGRTISQRTERRTEGGHQRGLPSFYENFTFSLVEENLQKGDVNLSSGLRIHH